VNFWTLGRSRWLSPIGALRVPAFAETVLLCGLVLFVTLISACDAKPDSGDGQGESVATRESQQKALSGRVKSAGLPSAVESAANELRLHGSEPDAGPDVDTFSTASSTGQALGFLDAGAPDEQNPGGDDAGISDAGPAGDAGQWDAGWADLLDQEPRFYFIGECDDVYVYIVSVDIDDPSLSSASLSLSGKGSGNYRRVGGLIGAYEVMAITDDWSGLNPKVYLRQGDEVCSAKLTGNSVRKKSASKRAASLRRKAASRRKKAARRKARARRRRRKRRRRRERRRRRRRKKKK